MVAVQEGGADTTIKRRLISGITSKSMSKPSHRLLLLRITRNNTLRPTTIKLLNTGSHGVTPIQSRELTVATILCNTVVLGCFPPGGGLAIMTTVRVDSLEAVASPLWMAAITDMNRATEVVVVPPNKGALREFPQKQLMFIVWRNFRLCGDIALVEL